MKKDEGFKGRINRELGNHYYKGSYPYKFLKVNGCLTQIRFLRGKR